VRVGERLGLGSRELEDLEYAALLHDLGRVAIQFDVFSKRSPLDEEERASVRNHPEASHELMRDIAPLQGAAELVLAHHEQPDGGGYPRGLTAERIPQGSAIIMVVAAFDAMTSDRPYRRGLSAPQAYAELRDCAGKMFFPEVVEAFIELHESGALHASLSEDELWAFGPESPAQTNTEQDVGTPSRRRNQPARGLVGQP
jgi:HD-GYP domain-containing protein (c-di-GMP phosphodiesterase class II)